MILLGAVVATSGVFSAFLVNDAICLVLAPLVLELTLALGRRPAPYLLAVAMASNVGSTATITGNPQNIMIGSFSHIPYTKFALALGPVALVGLVVTVALIALCHRAEFAGAARLEAPRSKVDVNRALVGRALLATLVMIALFFAGVVPAKAAIFIGGLLLLTRRVKSRRVYAEIDWSLLLMFAGLFIIVSRIRAAGRGRAARRNYSRTPRAIIKAYLLASAPIPAVREILVATLTVSINPVIRPSARRCLFRGSARRGRSGSTGSRQGWRAGNSAQRAGGTRRAMPRPPPSCAASR